MYIETFNIDGQEVVVKLQIELASGKPIIDMGYLGNNMRQTILSEELTVDFQNLIPLKIGRGFFEDEIDSHVIMTMMEQLKKVLQLHLDKYKRLLEADLGTYIAETIVFLDCYFNQVLEKSFESEKKNTFHLYFNFFNRQLRVEKNH